MPLGLPIFADADPRLDADWRLALSPAGACTAPADAAALSDWIEASAPGTAARDLLRAGRALPPESLQSLDVWYRRPIHLIGPVSLEFEGLATAAEVWLDDQLLLCSESMFRPARIDAVLQGGETLWIAFRALGDRLARRLPRARWRPRMIPEQGLRGVRTTLLGHMPGWTLPVHAAGPFRPVRARTAQRPRFDLLALETHLEGDSGQIRLRFRAEGLSATPRLVCAGHQVECQPDVDGHFEARLDMPGVSLWWPHTHGSPRLYDLEIHAGSEIWPVRRVGFRTLTIDRGEDGAGFGLRVNGEAVFCRGAVWTCLDLAELGGSSADYRAILERARDGGLNMLRLSGVGVYETDAFLDLCDELGILLWQDLMLANFDYPVADPDFLETLVAEVEAQLLRLAGRPSLSVVCGGSEIHQQAAMLGLKPEARSNAFLDITAPQLAASLTPHAAVVPNSPSGGALPFISNAGVAHYYGVGAYQRDLGDLRRADVRFASECLAFANVPSKASLKGRIEGPAVHSPAWKAGVPRDRGASWDFEDVRDHYLGLLYDVDPARLRLEDPDLYLDLSRAVSAEVVEAAFSEWRRPASRCGGALVWTLKDLAAGAGWGLLDDRGEAKAAWRGFQRAARPLHLGLTDEGVNGLAIHLVNEGGEPVEARLVLRAWRDRRISCLTADQAVKLQPRQGLTLSAFDVIGAFFDLNYAFRFGPPPADVVWAGLVADDDEILAEAFHFPIGRFARPGPVEVEAVLSQDAEGWTLTLCADAYVGPVHLACDDYEAAEDWLHLAPGRRRRLRLKPRPGHEDRVPHGDVRAPGGGRLATFG